MYMNILRKCQNRIGDTVLGNVDLYGKDDYI